MKKNMKKSPTGYKKPSYIVQAWWIIKDAIMSWFEWQQAKKWAEENRLSVWVYLATKGEDIETRKDYRQQILNKYRKRII